MVYSSPLDGQGQVLPSLPGGQNDRQAGENWPGLSRGANERKARAELICVVEEPRNSRGINAKLIKA